MATDTNTAWFPLFEFQDWIYQSHLVLPTDPEKDAKPGSTVTARKWGAGKFLCGQAFRSGEGGMAPLDLQRRPPFNEGEGYTLTGTLVFAPGVELAVTISGALGIGEGPASFEGSGIATAGPMKGAISRLAGWAFPELPTSNGAAKVSAVKGAVWAVRGTDVDPTNEPGGMPINTVGSFVLSRANTDQ